jgi:hypothetical protein
LTVYILKDHTGRQIGVFDSLTDARLAVHPTSGGYLYTEDDPKDETLYERDLTLYAKAYTVTQTAGNQRIDECGWELPDGSRLFMFSRNSHFEIGRKWPPSGMVYGSGEYVMDFITGANVYVPGNNQVTDWPMKWPYPSGETNVLPFGDDGPF